MSVAAVVLAAGSGSRFEGSMHKLLAPIDGVSVLEHSVGAALRASLDETIVVIGAESDAVRAVLDPGVVVCHNPDWSAGIATSLQVAIERARQIGHEAIVVGLGDQPGVEATAWRAVASVDAPIAVATYGSRRANPVRLARAVWTEVPHRGEEGARALMRSNPDLVVEVACSGDPADVDTIDDPRLDSGIARRTGQ